MPYDTLTAVTDDLNDNLAQYANEKKTAIEHVMSSSAYAAYTRTQSMTANVTLTDSDLPLQSFSPTADCDLTLPAIATTNHPFFVFNRSGSYTITVKNASAVVVTVLRPYSHVAVESDGANLWTVSAPSERVTEYKLVPTVSSNDLVLTLAHMDGTAPTTSRPLWFRIGNSWRSVSSSLSRTLADGTNWFNSGSAELGTKAVDYFAYVVWDSNSSAVGLTFARIPSATLVSDFSSTSTNQKYCAGYSDFTSTDDVVNIGRFEATLSLAGTSHLWTVPTFTGANLISVPIYVSRLLSWAPTITYTGGTTDPTSNTIVAAVYQMRYKSMGIALESTLVRGTGNRTRTLFSSPFLPTYTGGLNSFSNITGVNKAANDLLYYNADGVIYWGDTMAASGSYWLSGEVFI